MDKKTSKIIGPLEEVALEGDDKGRGRGEVEAFWSDDSRLLAINSFDGFSNEFWLVYKIEHRRAAIPAWNSQNGSAIRNLKLISSTPPFRRNSTV